jgi:hypothetical protein
MTYLFRANYIVEVFLKYLTIIQLVKKFHAFMEPKGSSLCSEKPIIEPHYQPAPSNLQPVTLTSVLILSYPILSIYA